MKTSDGYAYGNRQLHIIAILLVLVPIAVALYAIWHPSQSQYNPCPMTESIHGEVTLLTPTLVVVKTANGTNTLISLRKGTSMDPRVQVGNEVLVSMLEGQTVAITKLNK
jgi:hypothetical protein